MAAFSRQLTALEAISQVMKGLGFVIGGTASGSTDPTALQFWQLASEIGQQLLVENQWQFSSRDHTIVTSAGVSNYAIPQDWNAYIADSSWNRTNRLPALGSLREYEWQMLKARNLSGTTFATLFRLEGGEVVFYEAPSSIQTIVLPYESRAWCESAAGTPQDTLMADADKILYNPELYKVALERIWKEKKEFDTTKITERYNKLLSAYVGKDSPGRTLTLGRSGGYPYLGVLNIPDTGYG